MKYFIIPLLLLTVSCSKKSKEPDQNLALRCATFLADKMYTIHTAQEPPASEVHVSNDTIEADIAYFSEAFSRTVTGYDITKISDSLLNSEFGDYGKKYKKCYDKSDLTIKVFYQKSIGIETTICK